MRDRKNEERTEKRQTTYPLQIRLAVVQDKLEPVLRDADVEQLDDVGMLEFHQHLDLPQDREIDAVLWLHSSD